MSHKLDLRVHDFRAVVVIVLVRHEGEPERGPGFVDKLRCEVVAPHEGIAWKAFEGVDACVYVIEEGDSVCDVAV